MKNLKAKSVRLRIWDWAQGLPVAGDILLILLAIFVAALDSFKFVQRRTK